MQRLHENDLSGFLIAQGGWTVLSLPAINEDGTALYPTIMPLDKLLKLQRTDPHYFERQYMQNPQPMEGRMYQSFRTYVEIPKTTKIKSKIYVVWPIKGMIIYVLFTISKQKLGAM